MSFEIEDIDDEEEEESYNFQNKWSQPSKSFFGGQDNEMNDEDEYNFDFGKPKTKAKKTKSPQQWKAEPTVGVSNNQTTNKPNITASSTAPGNALNKAEDMLKKYGGGSSSGQAKRTSSQSKVLSLDFDENDISLDSDSESDPESAKNLSQSGRRSEMPFSPQAEAYENKVCSH